MEKFVGPDGFIRELELMGVRLRMRTGRRPQDEVTEVYASASDAQLAADFVRERWLSERYKPFEARPSLLTGAPPSPRSGGSLLLDASGTTVRREPPKPLQRLQAADPWAGDSKLAELEERGLLHVLERRDGALVAARVQVSDPLAGPRKSPQKTLLKAKASRGLRRLVVEVGHDEDENQSRARGGRLALKDHAKGRIHTWLAWQEDPGLPFGTALTARILGHDSPEAIRFVAWFRRLFD